MRATFLLFVIAMAGCVGPDELSSANTQGPYSPTTTNLAEEGTVAFFEINWTGRTLVGVGGDPWAHWSPPEEYTNQFWLEGFQMHTDKVQAMEFEIDWTALPETRIIFMAHFMNHTNPDPETMLEYNIKNDDTFSSVPVDVPWGTAHQGVLCMRVPEQDFPLFEDLEGLWQPMYHANNGGMVEATITVRVWGAEAMKIDGNHGHAYTREEIEGPFGTLMNPRPFEPCTGAP